MSLLGIERKRRRPAARNMESRQETLFVGGEPRGADGGVYVRVAVERGIDSDAGSDGLTYRIEGSAAGTGPAIGERVEVPLGRGGKPAAGVIVAVGGPELLDGFPASKVKPVLRRSG